MKKVCVIGHFGEGKDLVNGQTIKTKILTTELERILGNENVQIIDTHGGILNIPKLVAETLKAFRNCENIIILPAHNGIKFIAPMCVFFNKIWPRKVHYVVIGGWLYELLDKHRLLRKTIKSINYVYVETLIAKERLEKLGLNNLYIMQNFKPLTVLSESQLNYTYEYPLKVCTFSRVTEKKGIEDAVKVVKELNRRHEKKIYKLDIYGPIDSGQQQWFDSLTEEFNEDIEYRGAVDYNNTTSILKDYYLLLFPTKYYTEGVPGTIIDAYAAGVPVVASKWESFSDVIEDRCTGIGYEFDNYNDFLTVLDDMGNNIDKAIEMQKKCLLKAKNYLPETAIKVLVDNL